MFNSSLHSYLNDLKLLHESMGCHLKHKCCSGGHMSYLILQRCFKLTSPLNSDCKNLKAIKAYENDIAKFHSYQNLDECEKYQYIQDLIELLEEEFPCERSGVQDAA